MKTAIFTFLIALRIATAFAQSTTERITFKGSMGALVGEICKPNLKESETCPIVILMHGFSGNRKNELFDQITHNLAEKKIATLRFDFNAHGESEGEFRNMTVPNEIEDAKAAYAYASALPYVKQIALAGHSQGGVVAAMTAGQLGDGKVAAIALLAPATVLRDDAIRGNTFGTTYDPFNLPDYVTLHSGHQLGKAFIETAFRLPIYEEARKYKGPTLLIHGTGDRIAPYTYSERFNDCYKNAEFKLMEKVDHGFSGCAQTVARDVSDFMYRHLRPSDARHHTLPGVPQTLFQPATHRGRVETFAYNVKTGGRKLRKEARVYLPYGYDQKDKHTRYNVVYLMHGGGDNATSFFADSRSPLPLTQVLDHLIADGKMSPVIVITPTFYNTDIRKEGNKMEDAIHLTQEFHHELEHFLIPAAEGHYRTYLTGKDSTSVCRSRSHRAYGGFSMGALSTWYQLAYGIDAVKHFTPLSGDLWVYDGQGHKYDYAQAAEWLNRQVETSGFADDFAVYAYTGTKDIACTPQSELVASLYRNAPAFNASNLTFGLKEGGVHYYGDVNEYLYHALPRLWK